MSPNTDGPPAERNWEAPSMEHHIIDLDEPGSRYPVRIRKPPDRFQF